MSNQCLSPFPPKCSHCGREIKGRSEMGMHPSCLARIIGDDDYTVDGEKWF